MDLQQKYVTRMLTRLIKKAGQLVKPEHKDERLGVCRGCPNIGAVTVSMSIAGRSKKVRFDEGCTLCGCPLATKTMMKTLMRDPEKTDKPYTPSELVRSQFTNKEYIETINKCTDAKNGNDRWKAVDQKYN